MGNRILKAKIVPEFIFTFESNLQFATLKLGYPIDGFCNSVLACSDIVLKQEVQGLQAKPFFLLFCRNR